MQCTAMQRCRWYRPQEHCRRRVAAAAAGGGGGGGSGAPQPQPQPRRREFMLRSVPWLLLAEMSGGEDGRTILNSLLSAYGLPQLKATPGFKYYDDPEEPFIFVYPKAWVRRRNMQREGLIISDFQTADKLSLEVFPEPRPLSGSASTEALALAAVQQLMYPASDVGGDARLELPPPSRIKTEVKEIDGKAYTYIAWNSSTTTRSGYEVKRKNLAVAAARKGSLYVLGCSARSDQYDAAKEQTFQTIVESFRLL